MAHTAPDRPRPVQRRARQRATDNGQHATCGTQHAARACTGTKRRHATCRLRRAAFGCVQRPQPVPSRCAYLVRDAADADGEVTEAACLVPPVRRNLCGRTYWSRKFPEVPGSSRPLSPACQRARPHSLTHACERACVLCSRARLTHIMSPGSWSQRTVPSGRATLGFSEQSALHSNSNSSAVLCCARAFASVCERACARARDSQQACARACVHARVERKHACVRACERACVRACERASARASERECVRTCVRACGRAQEDVRGMRLVADVGP
jgi:hypothetical protein